MYLKYHNDGHFEAATGTLQIDSTEGIVEYQSCMWIADTKDGGASDWLPSIDGKEMKKWTQGAGQSDTVPLDHFSPAMEAINPIRKPVHAHCHCHGVEFWIKPPTPDSRSARSDYPDLMVPYHAGTDKAKNPDNDPWWLQDSGTRFMAGTCMCHSCRRASGFDVTFWAFVPNANIFLDENCTRGFSRYEKAHKNEYWGTMKTYRSSEGVSRTFCGRCGANVFWDGGSEKGREGLIDVAAGLLDADSGARAGELLSWWTGRVSFEEFAANKSLGRALGAGLNEWRTRRERDAYII